MAAFFSLPRRLGRSVTTLRPSAALTEPFGPAGVVNKVAMPGFDAPDRPESLAVARIRLAQRCE